VLEPHARVLSCTFESFEGRMAAVLRLAPLEPTPADEAAAAVTAALRAAFAIDPDIASRPRAGLPAPTGMVTVRRGAAARACPLDALGTPTNCGPGQNPLLFVAGLPASVGDEELAAAFSAAQGASVLRAWVLRGPAGDHKGYGFVEFLLPSAALAAAAGAAAAAAHIPGATLFKVEAATTRLARQQFSRTLFLDQFARGETSVDSLRRSAERFGPLADVSLPLFAPPHPAAGQPRGFAFLEFLRSDAAHAARAALDGARLSEDQAAPLRANFSNPSKTLAARGGGAAGAAPRPHAAAARPPPPPPPPPGRWPGPPPAGRGWGPGRGPGPGHAFVAGRGQGAFGPPHPHHAMMLAQHSAHAMMAAHQQQTMMAAQAAAQQQVQAMQAAQYYAAAAAARGGGGAWGAYDPPARAGAAQPPNAYDPYAIGLAAAPGQPAPGSAEHTAAWTAYYAAQQAAGAGAGPGAGAGAGAAAAAQAAAAHAAYTYGR